jgi:predicted flap endonuclease-1-like 5' DNA nuclease
MRLDFTLYGVAIVLFILSAVLYFVVPMDSGQLVYVIAAIVLGVLVAATGFVVRPKAQARNETQPVNAPLTPSPPAPEPVQPTAPAEVPVPPTEKVETPVAEVPPPEMPKEQTSIPPKVVEPPEMVEPVKAAPVLEAPEPTPQLSAPAEPPALVSPVLEARSDLTSIIGINAKRAEQLKANGINTVEDLAKASPEELAAKLEVSPKIVKMWVGSAKKRIK